MLPPHSIKTFQGLYGSSNTAAVPEGAQEQADNIVIRSKIPESRRGYKASASAGAPLNAIAFKESQIVALTYDTPGTTGTLRSYNPATNAWTTLPMTPGALTLDRPGITGAHTRFVSAQKALYFQSKYGLAKVETIGAAVCRAALQPRNWTKSVNPGFSALGVGTTVTANSVLAPAWLTNGNQVGYRFTLARFGANHELIESEPSEMMLAANATGLAAGVSVGFTYGWMTPPDSFLRVWRTAQVTTGTDVSTEFFLTFEIPVASGATIDSAGYAQKAGSVSTVSDLTPDTSLYVPLYTNAFSGAGIQNQNTPSPLGVDIAWFRSRMHHLNTSDVQRLTIKLIGTGTSGVQDGDWISIGSYKFYFKTSPDVTRSEIPLYTAGTVAANLENTSRALLQTANNVISADSTSIYGGGQLQSGLVLSYLSGGSRDAGQLLIQSIVPGAQAFTVKTSTRNGWDRDYTAGATSDPNAQAAGWMWSNVSQPEGVPTANSNPIGDFTAAGQRLIALKETLFAFKQDGLWKITDDGSALGPQLQLVDPTIRLIAPETAVALDNFILALADQGVILITETGGVMNISHTQIERELFKLMAYVGSARLAETAFGVAYQPEHTYILALPESPNATSCTVQYVYNLQTQAWTRWTLPGLLCGAVHPDTGQLYFGRSDGTLWMERKDFASSDYQDPGFTISSPTATQTATLTFAGDIRTGATPFAVGDIVQQWQAVNALAQRVIGVSYSSSSNQTTITLDKVPRYAWNQAVPLTIVKAIQCTKRFLPFTAGEPLTDKNWDTMYLSFRYCDLDFLSVGWSSEKYPITAFATERINNADGSANAPINLETWGSGTWGSKIWGRQTKDVVLKCTIPQDFDHSAQLTLSLTIPCALQRFELNAIDVKISGASDKTVR